MRIRRQKKGKLNNAGLSLVEIVVAMFILSAVTVTVLSLLVYSIRLNSRSRTRQQSTAAAQTVMENFKAYSVREICEQFAHLPDGEGTPKTFNVSGDAVSTQIIRVSSGTEFTPADSAEITELLSNENDLKFRIHNMKYQNELYDVEIELKGHTINGTGGNFRTADVDTLIVENFTSANSAAYVGDIGMDADALSRIAEKVAEKWTEHENSIIPDSAPPVMHTVNQVDFDKIKITNREIKVEVKKDGDNYVAEVSCVYTYQVDGYSYVVSETGTESSFDIPSTQYEYDNWDNTEGQKSKVLFSQSTILENLTLYYYPAYSNGTVKIGNDKIIVKNDLPGNSADRKIKCYIYKQRNLAVSDAKVSSLELSYNLQLSLGTDVYIYDDNLDTILGSPTSAHSYDPAGSMTNRYHGISYMAANPSATPDPDSTSWAVRKQRLMYDITVYVYKGGETTWQNDTALNKLTSTIIE